MSLKSHLQELERKHRDLDIEIEHERARPAVNDLRLASLKRQKLRIKEAIGRVSLKLAS